MVNRRLYQVSQLRPSAYLCSARYQPDRHFRHRQYDLFRRWVEALATVAVEHLPIYVDGRRMSSFR